MTETFVLERFQPPPKRRIPVDGDPVRRLPDWGTRITTENFIAEWNPPGSYEVNVVLPWPAVKFVATHGHGARALDSDRLTRVSAAAGASDIVPADCGYRAIAEVGWFGVVLFKPEFLTRLAGDGGSNAVDALVPVSVDFDPDFATLSRHYRHAFSGSDGGNLLYLESVVALLGVHVLRHASGTAKRHVGGPPPRAAKEVREAVQYIDAGLARRLSLSEMADVAGMGIYEFSRCFKTVVGTSPHRYVLKRRVERARELLATTDRPIADIAYAVGFSSQSHMTDTFRRLLDTTPGRYRRDAVQ